MSTCIPLTCLSWQRVEYHRSYVKSKDAQLSHGASEDYKHKPCVKYPLKRKHKDMMRSQSEPPGFDIWDVQSSQIPEG